MADISKIKKKSTQTEYNIKDSSARSSISTIEGLIPSSATTSNKLATAADIPSITVKADKVTSATSGNFAGLDTNGNLTDSGSKASDFLPSNTPIPSTANCYESTDTAETSLADDDKFPFYDTSASGKRSSTWTNIKAKLKSYFDTLYGMSAWDYIGTASSNNHVDFNNSYYDELLVVVETKTSSSASPVYMSVEIPVSLLSTTEILNRVSYAMGTNAANGALYVNIGCLNTYIYLKESYYDNTNVLSYCSMKLYGRKKIGKAWAHLGDTSSNNTLNVDSNNYSEYLIVVKERTNTTSGATHYPFVVPTNMLSASAVTFRTSSAAGPNASWSAAYQNISVSSSGIALVQSYRNDTDITQYCGLSVYAR